MQIVSFEQFGQGRKVAVKVNRQLKRGPELLQVNATQHKRLSLNVLSWWLSIPVSIGGVVMSRPFNIRRWLSCGFNVSVWLPLNGNDRALQVDFWVFLSVKRSLVLPAEFGVAGEFAWLPCEETLAAFTAVLAAYMLASSWNFPMFFLYRILLFPNQLDT